MGYYANVAACVAAALAVASPMIARADVTPTTGSCELHVWPSQGLRSVYYGWFHGGINDGAVTGRQGYPPIPRDAIDTALQVKLLSEVGLPGSLGLGDYKLIVHEQALDSRTIRTTPSRVSPDGAECYAELIIDDVFFREDAFTGSFLQSLIRFRDFGRGTSPVRTFGTWVKTRLTAFPPKADAQNEAALDELKSAFVANTAQFGTFLNKPPKKK
jgi:hypothetical protein